MFLLFVLQRQAACRTESVTAKPRLLGCSLATWTSAQTVALSQQSAQL